jgi:hypothetical protein
VLTLTGELRRAETLLQGVLAESARGAGMATHLIMRRAEVFFWQGRFEEAANSLAGAGGGSRMRLWRGLTVGLRGTEPILGPAVPLLRNHCPSGSAERRLAWDADGLRLLKSRGARRPAPREGALATHNAML